MIPSGGSSFTSLDDLFRSNNSNIHETNASKHASVPQPTVPTFAPRPSFESAGYQGGAAGAAASTSAAAYSAHLRPSAAPMEAAPPSLGPSTASGIAMHANAPPVYASGYMPGLSGAGGGAVAAGMHMQQPPMPSQLPGAVMSDLPPPPGSYSPESLSRSESSTHYHRSFLQPPAHPPRVPFPVLQQQPVVLGGGQPFSPPPSMPMPVPQQQYTPVRQPPPGTAHTPYPPVYYAPLPYPPSIPLPMPLPAAPSSPSPPVSTTNSSHTTSSRDLLTAVFVVLFLLMTVFLFATCRKLQNASARMMMAPPRA